MAVVNGFVVNDFGQMVAFKKGCMGLFFVFVFFFFSATVTDCIFPVSNNSMLC